MFRRSLLFSAGLGNVNFSHGPNARRDFADSRNNTKSANLHSLKELRKKLPQLQNINRRSPRGLGGTTIVAEESNSSSNNIDENHAYSFDGDRLLGAAFRAHKRVYLRKNNKNAVNEDFVEYLFHDQHCVVVPDAYPKSTFHFLVMPRMDKYPHLETIADITEKDVKLLRHMDSVSAEIVKAIFGTRTKVPSLGNRPNISDEEKILERILEQEDEEDQGNNKDHSINSESSSSKDVTKIDVSDKDLLRDWLFRPRSPVSQFHPVPSLRFMSGFHTLPSLAPLHLHLTSLDMQSDALKNKKHYNTFTTSFFVSRARVEQELVKHRYVKLAIDPESTEEAVRLENQSPMLCAWCQYQCKSGPELKEHLAKCLSNQCYFTQSSALNSA